MTANNWESAAIYSRKSRFTGKGESIENQIELCRRYIENKYGAESAANAAVYEDEGFSGGNLERPEFKKMMTDARKKRFSAIIVYRLDRISRNIGDFAGLIEELSKLEISFISIKEQFDTSSPIGRAMMYIASVFSQLERETIAERIRDNMLELAKTGRWLGGTTPTGYASEAVSKITIEGKVKKACRLKTVFEEARLVKLIYEVFLETQSLTQTDAFLLNNGYMSKNGVRFSRFTIKGILTNPVYMIADRQALKYFEENGVELFSEEAAFDGVHGIMAYNRTLQKSGKAHQTRPMAEWIVSVGAHEGLIPGRLWVCVQTLLLQNAAKGYRRPKSGTALLSGLLFCGSCGDYMRPKTTNRRTAEGEQVFSYLCQTKERSRAQSCFGQNAPGNWLDKAIVAEIKTLPEDFAEFRRVLSVNEKAIKGEAAAQKVKSAQADFSEIGAQTTVLTETELEELRARLTEFSVVFDETDTAQKREILKQLVKKTVWDGETVHIYLLCADTDAVPNLAFSGKKARQSMPDSGQEGSCDLPNETSCEDSK